MIRTLNGITPKVADTAWVSEFAYVVGNVEIGEYASIWPGVTVRGDGDNAIVIGDYVNIQEGSVIHGNGLVIEERSVGRAQRGGPLRPGGPGIALGQQLHRAQRR